MFALTSKEMLLIHVYHILFTLKTVIMCSFVYMYIHFVLYKDFCF